MKKIRSLAAILALSLCFSLLPMQSLAAQEPDLFCTNAVLVDADYDEILYDKKANEKAYPASITKVMTALLVCEAIERGELTPDTVVTASEAATSGFPTYSSTANIKEGEVLTVRELLFCLLLPSANEAATILAETVSGDVPTFVALMNARAQELGCENTNFINPHGLHNDQHYTSAYDITRFTRAALEHPLFREIIGTASHTVPATNLSNERFFYNTNGLISNFFYLGYQYSNCIGGKTGSTDEAGRCLMAVAESGDTTLISVVLGSGVITLDSGEKKQGQLMESRRLLQYGFENFHRVAITQADKPVDKVQVTLSRQADEVLVKPLGEIERSLPKDMDLSLIETTTTLFAREVQAPVEEGQVLGSMTLSYEDTVYGTIDLVAVTSVDRSELLYKKMLFFQFFQQAGVKIAAFIVLGLVLIILVRVFVVRKRRTYRGRSVTKREKTYHGSRR